MIHILLAGLADHIISPCRFLFGEAAETMAETSFNMFAMLWFARHWAAWAIALTFLSVLVMGGLVLARYVRICLNIFCDTHPPLAMGPLDFQPIYGEVVRFRSFDGTSLRGMRIPGAKGQPYRGTIVFCHEFGSDMYSCGRYARPLIDAGFDVFTFDFRGHGESSCSKTYRPLQWPSDKDMEDVLGACAHVESLLQAAGRPLKIGVFGISRGAGAALLAAATDTNICAILCDGAFCTDTTIIALMKRWASIFARWKLVYENNPESFWRFLYWLLIHFAQPRLGCRYPSVSKALRHMQPRPINFIHGELDSYIRVDQTRELYVQAPEPKYLWVVDGAKHNQSAIIQPEEYAARTSAFFRKYLSEEEVAEAEILNPRKSEVA